jgi:hypothetical protein
MEIFAAASAASLLIVVAPVFNDSTFASVLDDSAKRLLRRLST